MDKQKWIKYMNNAWKTNPSLGLNFYHRFRWYFQKDLQDNLQKLISNDLTKVINCKECILHLCTDNIIEKKPELLGELIWFQPASPYECLALLNHSNSMSNTCINQYTLRSLYYQCKCDMDKVIFFLPQIIQALNNDTNGCIFKFLYDVALNDMKMCHQLLWLCNCESIIGETKKQHKSTAFTNLVTKLHDEIIRFKS
eukprot:UN23695